MAINVNAKTIDGEIFKLSVNPKITIKEYKQLLMEKIDKPVTINVVFLGKILRDEQTIEQCNISDKATVIIVKKPLQPQIIHSTREDPHTNIHQPIENTNDDESDETNDEQNNHHTSDEDSGEEINSSSDEFDDNEHLQNQIQNNLNNHFHMFGNQNGEFVIEYEQDDENDENEGLNLPTLNNEDVVNINQMTNLGFNRNDSIQTYFACDRNVEMAVNILLGN